MKGSFVHKLVSSCLVRHLFSKTELHGLHARKLMYAVEFSSIRCHEFVIHSVERCEVPFYVVEQFSRSHQAVELYIL